MPKTAQERKEYMDSLDQTLEMSKQKYNAINERYSSVGRLPMGTEGRLEYELTYIGAPASWPPHFESALVLGAMMDPEYLDRNMTSSGFSPGTSTYIEFNQNFFVENMLTSEEREGWFPQVMLRGRREAADALNDFKKDPAKVYEYMNNFVRYAANQVKGAMVYGSDRLKLNYEFKGGKAAFQIAAELLETEPFASHIDIPEYDRMKLMAFSHQTKVKEQLLAEKSALMTNPPAANTKEREDAVAELMFKEYLVGTLANERKQLSIEGDQLYTEIQELYGIDPTTQEFAQLAMSPAHFTRCQFPLLKNIELNRTTDREVILSRENGVQELRDMYMESIRNTDTFKKLVSAKGADFLDQLIDLDQVAGKGFDVFKEVKTNNEALPFNRMKSEAYREANAKIESSLNDILDGLARKRYLIKAYDRKSLGRNRKQVEKLLERFSEYEEVLPEDKNLKNIRNGLTMLADQAASMEKSGKADVHNLNAYTATIDQITKSIGAFFSENGMSAMEENQMSLIRALRRLERDMKWNKSGIMEPERIKERERILRENAGTYEKPVKEGIDALVTIRRQQYEADALGEHEGKRMLITNAITATEKLGEMIKAGTPLVGESKETAVGYIRDILAERVFSKAYNLNRPPIHIAEHYAPGVVETIPGYEALIKNLSMTDIGQIVFEGRADRMLDKMKGEDLAAQFDRVKDQESKAVDDRIRREKQEREAAEKRERTRKKREDYKRNVLRRKEDYMENTRRIHSYYGSKGQFASGLRLSDEYNSLKIDVPKGLDENIVTAIVLGSMMKKERLDHMMTSSSMAGIDISFVDFNRDFLIDNMAQKSSDYERQGTFALAMVEGRRDALRAIDEYKNGNPEPAREMLRTFLDFAMDALMVASGIHSRGMNDRTVNTEQMSIIQLGTELIDKPPFHVTVEGDDLRKFRGLATEQVMETAFRVYEEKPDIFLKPKPANSKERIREIEDLMFHEYLMSTLNRAIQDKEDLGKQYARDIKEAYGFEQESAESREYSNAVSTAEQQISWQYRQNLVTDHEVLLSSKEGVEKLRELYMPEIRKTELYRKMISSEGTDYEVLFAELDETASNGLQSFKGVQVPPAAKEINEKNQHLMEEKKREFLAETDRAAMRLLREEMELPSDPQEAVETTGEIAHNLNKMLSKEVLKDKELPADMRKSLTRLRTCTGTFVKIAEKMGEQSDPVKEKDLQKYEEYGRFVGGLCTEFLSKQTRKNPSEAEKTVIRAVRRVRHFTRLNPPQLLELYHAKQRKDDIETGRGMRDAKKAKAFMNTHKGVKLEDPEFIYATISEKGLRLMSDAVQGEMAVSKAGQKPIRQKLIDNSIKAVKALTDMIAQGEAYVAGHQEKAKDYLRDIMAERILKMYNDLRAPLLEADRYLKQVVDKVPEMNAILQNVTVGNIGKVAFDGYTDTILVKYKNQMENSPRRNGDIPGWADQVYLAKHNEEEKEIRRREKVANDRKNEINLEEPEEPEKPAKSAKSEKDIKGDRIILDIQPSKKKRIIPNPEEDNKNEINLEEPEEENQNRIMPDKTEKKDKKKRAQRRDPEEPLDAMPKKKRMKGQAAKEEEPKAEPKAEPKEKPLGSIKAVGDGLFAPPEPFIFEELRNDPKPEEEKAPKIDEEEKAPKIEEKAPKIDEEEKEPEIEEKAPKILQGMKEGDPDDESEYGENIIDTRPRNRDRDEFGDFIPGYNPDESREFIRVRGSDASDDPLPERSSFASDASRSSHASDVPGIPPIEEDLIVNGESALTYIERIRDIGFPVLNTRYLTEEIKKDYGDKFLKIIAARQLADSVRRDPAGLEQYMLTSQQVDERVAEMKQDEVFKGFIEDIKKSRYKMVTAINAAIMVPGHGGKLDDMLKEYMLNLPPGELRNSKLHERFMPKIEDRIESIQSQVKKISRMRPANEAEDERKDHQLSCAVAEIIELRNLARAETGKKEALSKLIPCKEEDTLQRRVQAHADRESFRYSSLHRDVQRLISKGHGGQMMMKVRELDSGRSGRAQNPCEIIEANTIETRMKRLRRKAGALAEELRGAEAGSPEQAQRTQTGKNLLMEYSLLYAKVVNPETYAVEEDKLRKDVPWEKVRDLKRTETTFTRMFRHVFDHFKSDDIAKCLEDMSNMKLDDFKNSVNGKITEVSARLRRERQANPQVNHQRQGRKPNGRKK